MQCTYRSDYSAMYRKDPQSLNIDFPSAAIVCAYAQDSSAFMKDHVADDGIRKSIAEVSPFGPRVLGLIHAVVGCGKNPPVVFRIDDDGINRDVGQIPSAIAPGFAAVDRSENVASSKGGATCPYDSLGGTKDNNVTNKLVSRTR